MLEPAPPSPSTAVREMPEQDRPRERLEQVGAGALRDAELIAVLFRTGTREEGAVALAERLLRHFDGKLHKVAQASVDELQQVRGVGRVKAIEIKAALELGRRAISYARDPIPRIKDMGQAAALFAPRFQACETEHFKAMLLNTKCEVLKIVDVSSGTINATHALPLDVFRQAVRESAPNVIVAHNHPSGDPEPSQSDILLTQRLKDAGTVLGIELLDHIIIGDKRYVSLKDRGMM